MKIEASRFLENNSEKTSENEILKTPEQLQIINLAINTISELVTKYGGVPTPINPEQIHLVPGNYSGAYYPIMQNIYIETDSSVSKLDFLKIRLHELLHFFSYNSFFINQDQTLHKQHRGGLKINRIKKENIFHWLDEAFTEYNAITLFKEIRDSNSLFLEERQFIEKLSAHMSPDKKDSVQSFIRQTPIRFAIRKFHYEDERRDFLELINTICNSCGISETLVFDIFYKAYFTKQLSPLIRLLKAANIKFTN